MKLSILPVYVVLVFIICISLTRRATLNRSMSAREARGVYGLLMALLTWTGIVIVLGLRGKHVDLMEYIPLLWQPFVSMTLWMTAFIFSSTLRNGLREIATSTPGHWLVLIQALRIGALGGIVKGMRGEITSNYVFWIGVPDFFFGLSALAVAWLMLRKTIGPRVLIAWNLVGFSLIFLPTFVPMSYWMNEPGFSFIFEFPMVLAPSIVVPLLISLNLLHAWGVWRTTGAPAMRLGVSAWIPAIAVAVLPGSGAESEAETLTPAQKGRAVAEEADQRDLGWKDNVSEMRMVLRNRHGQESSRVLRRYSLEVEETGLGDRSLVIFDSPKDIEGTALLSHTKVLKPDDQWLYLPALKRVKRISSANKSGPFVGSEFAYEDLLSQEVDKYEYRWLHDEACGTLGCSVVERIPRYENTGYAKQIVWFDQSEYRVQKIEFYDRKNELLKTLTYHGYREYLDDYWRPEMMKMENHQTGKSTDLHLDRWEFQIGQTAARFTPGRLKRAR